MWELLCDTSRFAEWVAATAAVTRTDGPASHGSTYAEVNPILGPWKAKTSWTVVEFDPPRRQVHRTEDIPIASEFVDHGGHTRKRWKHSNDHAALYLLARTVRRQPVRGP